MSHELKKIHFVGAGPGDIELITIKGRRLLDEADCIVYAGSLINVQLLKTCKAIQHDSAGMDLEEILDVMSSAWKRGEKVVRLHTGDPAFYGAIKEQMQGLDEQNIPYAIVPGVSAASGAAASLLAELTLPEVSQTVIITRQSGRTPVPELEQMRLLASHRATMLIFLSVGMIDTVVEELLAGGYQLNTPVAVVEKATWDCEKIIRSSLKNIGRLVNEAGIKKTALICVGEVFADTHLTAVSKLYDKNFSHGTRKARNV